MGVTAAALQAALGAVLLVWKVQHPGWSYAYLVAAFTMPIVWVPGLRCAASPRYDRVGARPQVRRLHHAMIVWVPCLGRAASPCYDSAGAGRRCAASPCCDSVGAGLGCALEAGGWGPEPRVRRLGLAATAGPDSWPAGRRCWL